MIHKFVINGRLNNLNDYLQAERMNISRGKRFQTKGNIMKHQAQDFIIKCIRRDLGNLRITNIPVVLHYKFYEPNKKRDLDNVAAFCMKVTQDSLVLSKVLPNDGWNEIKGFDCQFYVDSENPRIEVEIEERK